MSLFKQFQTNADIEAAGVKVEYGQNDNGSVPAFYVSRIAKSNKRYSKALEAATRPYRRQIELGTMPEDVADRIFMEVFVSTILMGWENIESQDGSPLAFTKENAVQLLKALPELFDDLQEKAKQASMFREASLEDDAKN